MTEPTSSVESLLQLSVANLSLLRALLRSRVEIAETASGAELLHSLDMATMTAERLRLELALDAGDISFEDVPVEAKNE
jgi:hypothetical protein